MRDTTKVPRWDVIFTADNQSELTVRKQNTGVICRTQVLPVGRGVTFKRPLLAAEATYGVLVGNNNES